VNQLIFDAKAVGETNPYVVNFSDRLTGGESLNGASVTVTVFSGTDASPSSMLSGSATYDAYGNVTQNLTGGVAGVVYNIAFTVTATGSHNYVKVGQLAVISDSNPF
jgi:hypothetical protein